MRRGEGERPRILSQTPGRLRVHLPGWHGGQPDRIETRVRQLPGVDAARANPLTGNVLIRFDPRVTGPQPLLEALRPQPGPDGAGGELGRGFSATPFLRVGVRGLLGHAAVDALWFGAGFLGRSVGLPLAGLGPLHLLMDVVVWGAALASAGGASRPAPAGPRP
jgi:hypothetical protein